jgi:hypothetical protein
MAARDGALDVVKGMLVIAMLIIHTSNIFIQSDGVRNLIYPWLLGFVSGSWVLISGFIIGGHYRTGFERDRSGVTHRLLGRGWRLVAIFALVNLLLGQLSLTCSVSQSLRTCDPVILFLFGDLSGRTFEILLAIGYLLILSPIALWWPRSAVCFILLAIILATVASLAGMRLHGLFSLLLCGAAGIVAGGLAAPRQLSSLLTEARPRLVAASLAIVGCSGYLWQRMAMGQSPTALYIVYVMSVLTLMYLASVWIEKHSLLGRQMAVMAHYSLLAYIGQMGILQALRWLIPGSSLLASFPLMFAVALVVMLISLHILDFLRSRYGIANKAYAAVFG